MEFWGIQGGSIGLVGVARDGVWGPGLAPSAEKNDFFHSKWRVDITQQISK